MRAMLLVLSLALVVSCAREEAIPPEVAQELAKFDAEVKKLRDAIAVADTRMPVDRLDFRGRSVRQDVAQWVFTKSTLDAIETHRKNAGKTKFAKDADAALSPARKLAVAEATRYSALANYWTGALPVPFWREYWSSLYEANGLPVAKPDSMLVSLENDVKAALDQGEFARASQKAEEMVPVLDAAIDGATGRLTRQVGAPKFSARRSECPRGVEPERGQAKPQLVDSRPVNDFYPASAIARGETGSLVLRARVDAQGCAKEFAIVVRSGVESLNTAALEWFETARYAPATRGGRAVAAEHTFKVKFVLR